MVYEMNHVLELIDIDYPSPLNELSAHIIISRALFRDCYRGYKSEGHNPSWSSPKSNRAWIRCGSSTFDSPKSPECLQTPPHLSILVPSTSSTHPSSDRFCRQVALAFTEEEDAIYKEIRNSGCPTSFVSTKHKEVWRMERESCTSADLLANLDEMVLLTLTQPFELRSRAPSLSNLRVDVPRNIFSRYLSKDDCLFSETACGYSALCNILRLSFAPTHSNCYVPSIMHFYLPDIWSLKNIRKRRRSIESTLLGYGSCVTFNYKPQWLSPSSDVHTSPPAEILETTDGDARELEKYWNQRYRLFSRFDQGIKIDREGLFSVTPEVIAVHHARRLYNLMRNERNPVALDLFTGVGGNCIQLALAGFHVVTVDISGRMQEMARANAEIYGVTDKIHFIRSDVFDFLRSAERFDAILASPPWGGPNYSASTFSLAKAKISDEKNIFDLVEAIAPKIKSGGPVALFLPRNTDAAQLFDLHQRFVAADPLDVVPCLECEIDIINNKKKAITLYLHYGERCQDVDEEVNMPKESSPEDVVHEIDAAETSVLDDGSTPSKPTKRQLTFCTVL